MLSRLGRKPKRYSQTERVDVVVDSHVSALYDFVIQRCRMKRSRVPVTLSVPSDLAVKFERMAKAEAKNKSQLFRDMLATYEQRRREEDFFTLQRYGARQARKKGILTEADVEALVFQDR